MMTGAVFVLLNESHVTQVIQTSHGLAYPTLGYNNSLNQTRPRIQLGSSQAHLSLIHYVARIRARRLAQKG